MKIQMNPTQKTAETNRNNPFHLSLSISTRTVNEKKEGETVTEFFLKVIASHVIFPQVPRNLKPLLPMSRGLFLTFMPLVEKTGSLFNGP